MTSRPGPGITESLQRGSGSGSGGHPSVQHLRRPSRPLNNPQHAQPQDCIDPSLETLQRSADETLNKARRLNIKVKPEPLDTIPPPASDAPRPPPRGRPQLFFSNASDSYLPSPGGQSFTGPSTLPVPPRPGSSLPGHGSLQHRLIPGGTGVKGDAATKPPPCEAPAPAIVFPGGKTADLFQWTGNHPEDTMSEALVKGGISNKAQIMNETNTARPSLWSNLKNKSGLSTLSTLFVAVLEKRQVCGRLTAPNSFKPPPRLTLRDSTREAWLHDLANPTVGLRRLSRTIPHGITGKVLLEQCLNKSIPLPRALWLAKCVGINEMRAHKRKGQAGTITWVRGWTGAVEQFLDSVIGTIGQQEWKPRITYALQLVTHLYREHLLEDDHFLDWLLKNLESCPSERLFVWLLLVSVYWKDLSSSRRRGKRLADFLLAHIEKLHLASDGQRPSPIEEFLGSTIVRLLATSPSCFVLPKSWHRFAPVLRNIAEKRSTPQLLHIISGLDRRNERLVRQSEHSPFDVHSATRHVLGLLDSLNFSFEVSVEKLAFECLQSMSDCGKLFFVVLQWASSVYRDGIHRVYLVTRLIRRWKHLGIDVDEPLLSFLRSLSSEKNVDIDNVFRIFAELVRSKTFSVSRYIQWLIATGAGGQSQDLASPSAWPLRLLTEIPLAGISPSLLNLRTTLLRGANYSTESEEESLAEAEWSIQQQIPALFGVDLMNTSQEEQQAEAIRIPGASSTLRLELAIWLRSHVAFNVEVVDRVPTKDPSIDETGPVCLITPHDFCRVRSYIESFGDLSILADILGMAAVSLDAGVLAAAADTLRYHREAFVAIGAFRPLYQKISLRYAAIRTMRFPERELLVSLNDIACTTGVDGLLSQSLAYDLSRYDLKNSVAACSPVSDTMAESTQTSSSDTDDEIDRILNSGSSMDQQVMIRVFGKIILTLEKAGGKLSRTSETYANWYYRLRSFDENAFDKILLDWLNSLFVSRDARTLRKVLPPLVSSGCLALLDFLDSLERCMTMQETPDFNWTYYVGLDILHLLLPPAELDVSFTSRETYRFRIELGRLTNDPKCRILRLVRRVVEASQSLAVQTHLEKMLSSPRLRAVIRLLSLKNSVLVASSLRIGDASAAADTRGCLNLLLEGLLDPTNNLGLSLKDFGEQTAAVVASAQLLSLTFCRFKIQQLYFVDSASSEGSTDAVSVALLESVKRAVEKDETPWSDLITGLDVHLKSKICEYAEREILTASSFLGDWPALYTGRNIEQDDAFLRRYLLVIDCTASEAFTDGQAQLLTTLVERLRAVADTLGRHNEYIQGRAPAQELLPVPDLVYTWLRALLRLVVHASQKVGHANQAALLWCLRALLVQPSLQLHPVTAEYVWDVAINLSDSLTEDSRNRLSQLNSARSVDDARSAFIFGNTSSPDGWLALSKPVGPAGASQAGSSPQTQSADSGVATQSQQSYQSQPSQSPSPAALQRSLSQQYQQAQALSRGHTQHNKPQQFHRMGSNSQTMQSTQFQQLQQMQQMQQRNTQPSPVHLQKQTIGAQQSPVSNTKGNLMRQEKVEMKLTPFDLRRWEILPESSGNLTSNDTALSLSLFGARKV